MRLPKKSNFFCFNFHTTLIPDDPVDKLLSNELGVRALFLLHKTMQSHTKMCLSMCATNKKENKKLISVRGSLMITIAVRQIEEHLIT